jgi:mono/diheme cytochrome c family protein
MAVLASAAAGSSLVLGLACGGEELNPAVARHDAGADFGINTSGAGAGSGADTGLPCDVQQLLENRCIGCHMSKSPPPLLTLADLVAPSASDPSKSMAAESLARMQSAASPMPPPPAEPPTADEIQIFAAWVAANLPKGAPCTGGAAAPTSYATPSVCTSGKTWRNGDDGSPNMHPGGACLTCHASRGGPSYKIAGTVYPTAHEPNDCDGVATALTVVVTGADGVSTSLPVNSVGNFYSRSAVVAPFHVKVTDGTKERAMTQAVTAGDCNSCHTEQGANGAPGRIMAP